MCRSGTSSASQAAGSADFVVFDLDPGEGTSVVECCEVAGHVMDELDKDGMEPFAKTSGSKGLQLYAAVGEDDLGWPARSCMYIARKLESEHRELVVSNMRRSLRRGRVLIDWSQNHPAKTTVGVYSVRAMPAADGLVTGHARARCTGAPPRRTGLLRFETEDVLRRVEKDGDLFALRSACADGRSSASRQTQTSCTVVLPDGRPNRRRDVNGPASARTRPAPRPPPREVEFSPPRSKVQFRRRRHRGWRGGWR